MNQIQPRQEQYGAQLTKRQMDFAFEVGRSYAYSQMPAPEKGVYHPIAIEMAEEIPVKDEHIPRLFIIARRDFRPIPTLSDLKKALATLKGDLEEEERRKRPWIKDQTQPISNEEREIIMQDMWAAAAKVGIYRPSDNVARKK
jgi:hypothetical protein